MNSLIANKSFVYEGSAEDIKNWLYQHGFTTEELLDVDKNPVAFRIIGTLIKVGYHRPLNEYDTGKPKVHLLNGPHMVSTDADAAQAGLTLYPKLYRKFRSRQLKGDKS